MQNRRRSIVLFLVIFFTSCQSVVFAAGNSTTHNRLQQLINSDDRSERMRMRNRYRHPLETLSFMDIQPDQTVVEIWPGGSASSGWYRSILEPFFAGQAGKYVPVQNSSSFPDRVESVPDSSADRVLVFRAHGFLIYKKPIDTYYQELYRMLKPGGIFGIVDHRELENKVQDPKGENGYVQQSYLIKLAEKAGFQLLEQSEINGNPLDTKDHPDGLYSLPPTLSGTTFNSSLKKKMQSIGESDRMTLKFIKPLT